MTDPRHVPGPALAPDPLRCPATVTVGRVADGSPETWTFGCWLALGHDGPHRIAEVLCGGHVEYQAAWSDEA